MPCVVREAKWNPYLWILYKHCVLGCAHNKQRKGVLFLDAVTTLSRSPHLWYCQAQGPTQSQGQIQSVYRSWNGQVKRQTPTPTQKWNLSYTLKLVWN